MKRRFKKILLFVIFVISIVLIYPINTNALSSELPYIDINDIKTLNFNDLSFSNIEFKDYSNTSTKAFGLSGEVINNYSQPIAYNSRVSYYDKDYNLITEVSSSTIASVGSNQFNLMFNLDILGEYSTADIKYYSLSVSLNTDAISLSNNTPSENSNYSSYDYVIDNYNVNIVVNENNTFDITETITAYFNVPKHGIYRIIPLINNITRVDGTTSANKAQILNLEVSDTYTASKEYENYKIQIGSSNETIIGKKTYTIKYTYNLGKDNISSYDELYYNIIGSEWDTVIGNITFNITMPKEFDESKLGFSSGLVGSTDNSKINYIVNGNTISGSYDGILDAGEALTVRCELPEGYFVDASFTVSPYIFLMFIIPVISLVLSFILWFIFGRDNKVVKTVEFYPPAGFNSLEVGFLYKGEAEDEDVLSLLIYLANKGYIKILNHENKSSHSKTKNYKIIKLKEYDGDNSVEKEFLDKLIAGDYVLLEDLFNKFSLTKRKILTLINSKDNKNKIINHNIWGVLLIAFLILISVTTIVITPYIGYISFSNFIFFILILLLLSIPFIKIIYHLKFSLFTDLSLLIVLLFILVIANSFISVYDLFFINSIYVLAFILGIISILGMIFFLKIMEVRTDYGSDMLNKIESFKTFLENARESELVSIMEKDKTYFYDMIPFAYSLGVLDTWLLKLRLINISPPLWYDENLYFDSDSFINFINDLIASINENMLGEI